LILEQLLSCFPTVDHLQPGWSKYDINPIIAGAFRAYKDATGGVEDGATGLLRITPAQYQALQPLNFHIGDNTYTLNPNAQIWPRSLNTDIGGLAKFLYLVIGNVSLLMLSSEVQWTQY
jgi:hypothetical protein